MPIYNPGMLHRFLAPHTERAFALLRIVTGFLMAMHGAQKFGLLGPTPVPIALLSQVGIGGAIEIIGGSLVMLGLATVPAAFLLSGTMAVAYIQFHWKFQLGLMLLPIKNAGELALVYCLSFLYVACHGAGIASIDGRLARRRG
jgi:putative oxidoreductase